MSLSAKFPKAIWTKKVKQLDIHFTNSVITVDIGKHKFRFWIEQSCGESTSVRLYRQNDDKALLDVKQIDWNEEKQETDSVLINRKLTIRKIRDDSPHIENYHSIVFGLFDSNTKELLYVLKFINIHNGYYPHSLDLFDENSVKIFRTYI